MLGHRSGAKSRQSEREKRGARSDGDVLLAVDRVSHRTRVDRSAALKVPQDFSGGGVERHKIPFRVAGENEPTSGRKHSGPRRREMLELPLDLTRRGIDSANRSPKRLRVI